MGLQLTRRRRILFAFAAIAIAAAVTMALLIALDVYLHRKFERSAGFNVWGYRGPVAARKQKDEYRIVVLGGSAADGYGTTWEESIPAVLGAQPRRPR